MTGIHINLLWSLDFQERNWKAKVYRERILIELSGIARWLEAPDLGKTQVQFLTPTRWLLTACSFCSWGCDANHLDFMGTCNIHRHTHLIHAAHCSPCIYYFLLAADMMRRAASWLCCMAFSPEKCWTMSYNFYLINWFPHHRKRSKDRRQNSFTRIHGRKKTDSTVSSEFHVHTVVWALTPLIINKNLKTFTEFGGDGHRSNYNKSYDVKHLHFTNLSLILYCISDVILYLYSCIWNNIILL